MRSLHELMNLSGRVVVITGGAGHLGAAAADALAELGATVVLVDVAAERCAGEAARVAATYGIPTLAITADLEDTASVQRIPQQVEEAFGRLDVLLHSAALVGTTPLAGWSTPFAQQRIDTWRRALEVNLTAAFALIQASAPMLARSGHGAIVAVASIYGLVGPDWRLYENTALGNPAAYGASKAALLQLVRWLSTTLAPDIRANAITPGGIFRNTPEPFLSRYVERTPLGRMAREEDFKGAIAYLSSDLSAYVTGQNLVVDGGWTAW